MGQLEKPAPQFDRTHGPLVFAPNLTPLYMGDMYLGATAFLICSGPSLDQHDLTKLSQRGILSCSVNNAGTVCKTNLWVCFDDPGNFSDVIWRDPSIMKFVVYGRLDKTIRIRNKLGELVETDEPASEMPNTFGYRSNSEFEPARWLTEDTANCGQHGKDQDELGIMGSRSVMLVATKILYYLGIRRIFLLGCDFNMKYGQRSYAFEQHRTRASVRGNNRTYRALNARFEALQPHFDQAGFKIFNCTPNSGLTVFPFVEYETAIEQALEQMPKKIQTDGMYDMGWRERSSSSTDGGE